MMASDKVVNLTLDNSKMRWRIPLCRYWWIFGQNGAAHAK
jgi:hypothetical protein